MLFSTSTPLHLDANIILFTRLHLITLATSHFADLQIGELSWPQVLFISRKLTGVFSNQN